MPASGQGDRGGHQLRRGSGPGPAVRHAGELAGQGRAAPRLDDLADRQLVDDDTGGQRPVAGPGGVPHRVGEPPVPLVPPGRLAVQRGHLVRMLALELQPQHLREQRVVAVPSGPGRLDKRVRARQGRQDCPGLLVAGQLAGGLGADLLQDAGVQQDIADRGRLGIEDLRHQVAGQGAVVGDQLGNELVRAGMGRHRDRGQPQARSPALGPPGQGLQRVRRQRDAVPGQQLPGFGGGERQVAGPDLGQLPGQPVTVHRQRRVHPCGHHQPQPRAGVPQHVTEPVQHLRAGQQMQVIEDHRHRRVLGSQHRRQPQQEPVPGIPPPPGRQHRRDGHAGPAQRRHHMGPEEPRPVIELIHRDPGHRPWLGRRPRRQRHRLARPRRAGDRSQRAPPPALGDQLGDPRPRHRPVRHTRRRDLRCQDRNGGRNRRPPSAARRRLPGQLSRHRDLPASSRPAA